jgi:hypothetical protein
MITAFLAYRYCYILLQRTHFRRHHPALACATKSHYKFSIAQQTILRV